MSFIPIPHGIEVVLHFTLAGQEVVLTIGVGVPGTVVTGDLFAASHAVSDWWYANLRPLQSNNLALQNVTATDLTTDSGPIITNTEQAGALGSVVNQSVPNNVAVVASFRSLLRGRSYRGRNYVPGISTTLQASPTAVTTAAAIAINTAYGLLNGYFVDPMFHAILSRFHNKAPRAVGVVTPVEAYITNANFDSQRRRLAGRGV